jgi:hypothetical protein
MAQKKVVYSHLIEFDNGDITKKTAPIYIGGNRKCVAELVVLGAAYQTTVDLNMDASPLQDPNEEGAWSTVTPSVDPGAQAGKGIAVFEWEDFDPWAQFEISIATTGGANDLRAATISLSITLYEDK